jgi:hypothetical protein
MKMTQRLRGLVPYLVLLLFAGALFPSSGRDDVHITYWASHTLVTQGEITNYNGDRVEQSSSLAQSLLLAILTKATGFDVVDVGGVVAILFGLLVIAGTGRLAAGLTGQKESALPAALLAASSVPLAYWSFGGLEGTMVAAIGVALLLALQGEWRGRRAVIVLATFLLVLSRPEAIFVVIAFVLGTVVLAHLQQQPKGDYLLILAAGVVAFALVTAFRTSYFGAIFPQPVSAKVGTSLITSIHHGLGYLLKSTREFPLIPLYVAVTLLTALSLLIGQVREHRLIPLTIYPAAYFSFVVTSGGDWMEGLRFFVPFIAPMAAVLVWMLYRWRGNPQIAYLLAGVQILSLVWFAYHYSTGTPLHQITQDRPAGERYYSLFEYANRVHLRDIEVIERLDRVTEAVSGIVERPAIMSIQAGMVPFHIFRERVGKLRFIDMRGLTSRDFTDCDHPMFTSKSHLGVIFWYDDLFAHIDQLKGSCGISRPEIIFDLFVDGSDRTAILEANGYTIVYLQQGEMRNRGILKGGPVSANEFIALRNDIAEKLEPYLSIDSTDKGR